jgi:putative transposase
MSEIFDFEKAIAGLRSGKDLMGNEDVLMPLIKQLTEAATNAELKHYPAKSDEHNRENGKTSKTVKTVSGLLS